MRPPNRLRTFWNSFWSACVEGRLQLRRDLLAGLLELAHLKPTSTACLISSGSPTLLASVKIFSKMRGTDGK